MGGGGGAGGRGGGGGVGWRNSDSSLPSICIYIPNLRTKGEIRATNTTYIILDQHYRGC